MTPDELIEHAKELYTRATSQANGRYLYLRDSYLLNFLEAVIPVLEREAANGSCDRFQGSAACARCGYPASSHPENAPELWQAGTIQDHIDREATRGDIASGFKAAHQIGTELAAKPRDPQRAHTLAIMAANLLYQYTDQIEDEPTDEGYAKVVDMAEQILREVEKREG